MGDEGSSKHEKMVRDATERARGLGDGEAYVWVVRTVTRLRADGGGYSVDEDLGTVDDNVIQVGTFRTAPARVMVQKGLTVNLGNFESARVTVGYECPCYLEELREVDEHINAMVERRIQDEVLEIVGRDKGGEAGKPVEIAALPADGAPSSA